MSDGSADIQSVHGLSLGAPMTKVKQGALLQTANSVPWVGIENFASTGHTNNYFSILVLSQNFPKFRAFHVFHTFKFVCSSIFFL